MKNFIIPNIMLEKELVMQVISSKANEQIKHIKKLFQKKYREEYSEFVIEGIKIVKEAIAEGRELKAIYINEQNKD